MIDVTRPDTSPASLAEKKYNGRDVLETLHKAFLGKCYLCETRVEVGTFEVDHRKPKAEDQFPELAYEWKNLFPTCNTHRCNQRRERKYPTGGLLDPAAGDRVEARIIQRILGNPSGVLGGDAKSAQFMFQPLASDDLAAVNTAQELDRIHNGTGSTAKDTAFALRRVISNQVVHVAKFLRELTIIPPEATGRRDEIMRKLGKLFSRRAPYTMLVRSYFAHRPELSTLLD